jgi:phosphoglucosamine mutase
MVVRTKVWDVEVAAAVRRHKTVFGGEPCGAWIHPQHHYCPDGVLSSVLLLKALEDENACMDGWILVRPSGTEPLIRITVEAETVKEAESIMEEGIRQVKKSVEEATK